MKRFQLLSNAINKLVNTLLTSTKQIQFDIQCMTRCLYFVDVWDNSTDYFQLVSYYFQIETENLSKFSFYLQTQQPKILNSLVWFADGVFDFNSI